jgi:hypothetical protein
MSLKIDSVSLPLNRPVTAEGGKAGLAGVGEPICRSVSDRERQLLRSSRDKSPRLPRAADVLNFVRQLPASAQVKIATENPIRLYRFANA